MKSVGMKLPIEVSNADKIFWPEEGYTKLDLLMLSIQRAPQDENVHCTGVRKCRKDFGPAVGAVSDYRHFSGAE